MKPRGPDNVAVYYGTAVVSALIILAYIAAGEVTPIVGFLVGGVLMFALYPNKTIALVAAILVSAALRKPNREGMEDKEPEKDATAKPEDLVKKATALADAVGVKETTPTPAAAPTKAAAVKEPLDNKHEKGKEKFVGTKELSPAELPAVGGASSPQDVEKLSKMIDKTMELLKMLPDGFLQNAVK